MRRKTTLKELLTFRPSKGPGFGISAEFYLSVLACQVPLPSIKEIVEPSGAGGAVLGFGVPLNGEKDALEQPMERGAYALASPDRKTVIRGLVMSKEEAGFNPVSAVESGLVDGEMAARMRATWMIVQLTFESFDPEVYPAVEFILATARRLGALTSGVVADPVSQTYRLPGEMLATPFSGLPFHPLDVVALTHGPGMIQSAGLRKFGLPELVMNGVPGDLLFRGDQVLTWLTSQLLLGSKLKPGQIIGLPGASVDFQLAYHGDPDGERWEVIPAGVETISETLAKMEKVLGESDSK